MVGEWLRMNFSPWLFIIGRFVSLTFAIISNIIASVHFKTLIFIRKVSANPFPSEIRTETISISRQTKLLGNDWLLNFFFCFKTLIYGFPYRFQPTDGNKSRIEPRINDIVRNFSLKAKIENSVKNWWFFPPTFFFMKIKIVKWIGTKTIYRNEKEKFKFSNKIDKNTFW